ncbi:response regulator [Haloarchaeobius sp. DFWS5]|uniref:response regulator n=1 Tax=Haloarchaeobius sp. DFWS5 TaxID=3446114 RepID=UPI003EBFB4F4
MTSTVVVADDDEDLRVTLEIWLKDIGSNIVPATNGQEALEALESLSNDVDVLLIDRRMPGLSGDEVVKRLKESSFTGRIIAMSAHPPNDHLSEDDVDEYLTKPLYQNDVVDTVRKAAL